MVGPITYTTHNDDPYRFMVHEIIEQMLSIKAGAKIFELLDELCNGNINPLTVSNLSEEEIKSTGTSSNKARYIKCLTNSVIAGDINFAELEHLSDEDVAFLQSFCWLYKIEHPTKAEIIKKCSKWSPYSSIASRYLYRALDLGLTKREFHLYK